MYCTRCGQRNPDDASYCSQCGSSLHPVEEATVAYTIEQEPGEEGAISLETLRANQALLVVKGGPAAGSTYLVDQDAVRAGRHPDSELFLNDITVSRRHCEIQREGGRFVVKDVGSLNGTYVNRQRVDAADLSSGDEIQIGKFKIVFYTAPSGD